MQIEHAALWTTDLERALGFYATFFEARCGARYTNPKTGFSSYFLTFESGARLEIMQLPDLHPAGPQTNPPAAGWAHLAFTVGSDAAVDALTQRLEAAGYRVVSGPRRTGDGYYESVILDPDGNRLEICA